jgi:2,3-bisphosphoglycerate-dependent phosphoglycerate mutase
VTRLVLIRHGESQVYVDGLVGGLATCNGLSDLGRRQAAALRDRLASTHELDPVDVLIASTLPRARETAQIISPAIGSLRVIEDEEVCEIHPGEADGLAYDDYIAKYGWRDMEADPHLELSPGGESIAAFHGRVGAALTRIAEAHPERTVVIACHGGVVDVGMRTLLGLGMVGGFDLYTENTSMTEFVLVPATERRPLRRWRLVRYNDAAHLAGIR